MSKRWEVKTLHAEYSYPFSDRMREAMHAVEAESKGLLEEGWEPMTWHVFDWVETEGVNRSRLIHLVFRRKRTP